MDIVFRSLTIWVISMLLGCSAVPPPPRLYLTTEDAALSEPLHLAIMRWQAATGLSVKLTNGLYPGLVHVRSGDDCAEPQHQACWRGSERTIVIRPSVADHAREIFIVHEIGHALGAEHHDAPGVMRSHVDVQTACITWADVRAVCRRMNGACLRELPEC